MSPPPENSPEDSGNRTPSGKPASHSEPAEYSPEERKILLGVAHESILAKLEDRDISFEPPTPHLGEKRGAFTTLHCESELRGCVGFVFPVNPLYRTVAETARAAAFEDSRFEPVTAEEACNLQIEISVMSPLQTIAAEDVEVGRHGLLITLGTHRGLLLPQVSSEHGWDRVTFLEQTCRKAGLPRDAWQRGARLEAFTAEIFGDGDG
jgi:AmmeMemoRadiSam system protein A